MSEQSEAMNNFKLKPIHYGAIAAIILGAVLIFFNQGGGVKSDFGNGNNFQGANIDQHQNNQRNLNANVDTSKKTIKSEEKVNNEGNE